MEQIEHAHGKEVQFWELRHFLFNEILQPEHTNRKAASTALYIHAHTMTSMQPPVDPHEVTDVHLVWICSR